MNELTSKWTPEAAGRSKNKIKRCSKQGGKAFKKSDFTSENRHALGRSKKVEKKFDDSVTILIVCQTSAVPADTQVTVEAAGLTNRQGWLLPRRE